MKKQKKLFALCLVLSLLCTLCACGNAPVSTVSEPGPVSASVPEETPTEQTTTPQEPISEEPHEGSVIDSVPAEIELPIVEETTTLSYWLNYGQDAFTLINSFDESRGYQTAEEMTNVHIDFKAVSMEQQTEQFHIMVASGDWPDLIQNFGMLYTGGAVAGYTDGVILDFADMANEYLPHYMYLVNQDPETAKAVVTDDGMMLSLYTLFRNYMDGPLNGMCIRQDWLDDLGLDVPQTYDELHDVLVAFRDQKGAKSPMFLINAGAYENGALASGFGTAVYINTEGDGVIYPFYQENGAVKYGPMEQGFVDYVTMLNGWVNEGLINKDFSAVTGNPMDDQFLAAVSTGETGYFNVPSMLIDIVESMVADPNVNIQPIPDVGKVAGQDFALGFLTRNYNTAGASISSTCEIPEIALKWSDFFYTEEGSLLTTYGVEGESYEIINGSPQFTDLVANNPDGYTPVTVMTKYSIGVDSLRNSYLNNEEFYSDKVVNAGPIWGTGRTGEGELPINISMTSEETEEFNAAFGDICTYCQEMIAKFISGDVPLEDIPKFQDTLKDMGIEKCIALKQSALDRYNSR